MARAVPSDIGVRSPTFPVGWRAERWTRPLGILIVVALILAFAALAAGPIRGVRSDIATMRTNTSAQRAMMADQLAVLREQATLIREQATLMREMQAIQVELLEAGRGTRSLTAALERRMERLEAIARQLLAELREISERIDVLPAAP